MKKKKNVGGKRTGELTVGQGMDLDARLGKEKDIDLAAEFGITRQRISQRRTNKGIPRFQPEAKMGYPIPVHFTKTDELGMNAAMKKTGEKNRSKYIRGAVRDKNSEVLGS